MYFNWQVTTIYKTGHDKPKAKLNLTTPSITQCMQYSYRPRDRRCGEYLSCLWRWSSGVAIHSRVRHPTNWIFFKFWLQQHQQLTLMTSWAIAWVTFTLRAKHSLASESFPSRNNCFPFRRPAWRFLKDK